MPISTVNHEARNERHHKLFGKIKSGLARFRQSQIRVRLHAENARKRFISPLDGLSPAQRLFQRVLMTSIGLVLINSMNFAHATDVGGTYMDGLDLEVNPEEISFVEDDGYLLKIVPPTTEKVRYLNRAEETTHEVQQGETLSEIAYIYGLNLNTIFWANSDKMRSANSLKVGQQLTIPVVDGVKVTIKEGETLASLIKKHKGKEAETKALTWNKIGEDGKLTAGQPIVIVSGQPYVAVVAAAKGGGGRGGSGRYSGAPPGNVVASPGGQGWIKPTAGVLTQGYRGGHYAFDVAAPKGTPIVSAASGVVTTALADGWGGGYGTYVIIQHDNGCETLYAHNSEIYVKQGDYVSAGQVISAMGASGRVYGRTGVHLHFELRCNGVKLNPKQVFGW